MGREGKQAAKSPSSFGKKGSQTSVKGATKQCDFRAWSEEKKDESDLSLVEKIVT